MMEFELKEAFKTTSQQKLHLQRARYWYEHWKNEFPSEEKSTADGYEGTAQYAEVIGDALGELGCGVDENILRESVLNKLNAKKKLLDFKGQISLDSEGYYLGSVAAFILRFDRHFKGWENRVIAGETPLDVLLKDFSPSPVEVDKSIFAEFQKNTLTSQQDIDAKLRSAQTILKENNFVIVNLPADWKLGSTRYQGFFLDQDKGIRYSVLATDIQFLNGINKIFASSNGVLTQFTGSEKVCQKQGWSFLIRESEINYGSGTYTLNNELFKGTSVGAIKLNQSGQKFFCAGE